mgnify:CR=1 FL=1
MTALASQDATIPNTQPQKSVSNATSTGRITTGGAMSKPKEILGIPIEKVHAILGEWLESDESDDYFGGVGAPERPRKIIGMKKRVPLSPEESLREG